MLEEEEVPLFAGGVRRLVAFQKAALKGVPVYETQDPRAQDGWQDYCEVGRELIR